MNVRKVLQRIEDFVALHYSSFAFPCIYVYTQGIVECIEWEYMPSILYMPGVKLYVMSVNLYMDTVQGI